VGEPAESGSEIRAGWGMVMDDDLAGGKMKQHSRRLLLREEEV
jgi:hypothetical protein